MLLKNPRLLGQAMLFRDKSLMKRRAQPGGIRVGVVEKAHDRGDVIRFLKRVNQTLLKLDGDPNDPIHFKAFDKSGTAGHRVVRTPEDVDNIPDEEFPALLESHLDGWEFAVEAWIKNGKIEFLNISEYVTMGYSVFVSATPELEVLQATANHPYFEYHELNDPREQKVAKRSAFGTHWGLAYFFGEDAHQLRDLLNAQEELDHCV